MLLVASKRRRLEFAIRQALISIFAKECLWFVIIVMTLQSLLVPTTVCTNNSANSLSFRIIGSQNFISDKFAKLACLKVVLEIIL